MPPTPRKRTASARTAPAATAPDTAPDAIPDTAPDTAPGAAPWPDPPTATADTLWDAEGQADADPGDRALTAAQLTGLRLLRSKTPEHLLSLKPINVSKDGPKAQCGRCGAYGGRHSQHLTFAGHAAITDRLLEADPAWSWCPVIDPGSLGFPIMPGSLWIALTVCGVTRYGVGDAEGRSGNNAVKELIGDALRNAAMRFGVGLELWHKGDLHALADTAAPHQAPPPNPEPRPLTGTASLTDSSTAAAAAPPTIPSVLPSQALQPGVPDDPQDWVDRMLATQSLAATSGLARDAALAGHMAAEVVIGANRETVALDQAFARRTTWLRNQAERVADQEGRG